MIITRHTESVRQSYKYAHSTAGHMFDNTRVFNNSQFFLKLKKKIKNQEINENKILKHRYFQKNKVLNGYS